MWLFENVFYDDNLLTTLKNLDLNDNYDYDKKERSAMTIINKYKTEIKITCLLTFLFDTADCLLFENKYWKKIQLFQDTILWNI